MKREAIDLLVSETSDVQCMHPALELLTVSDTVLLRGKIGFDMGAGSQRISDAYQIMMRFPEDYPGVTACHLRDRGRYPTILRTSVPRRQLLSGCACRSPQPFSGAQEPVAVYQ